MTDDVDPDKVFDVRQHLTTSPAYHLHLVQSTTPADIHRLMLGSSRTDQVLTTRSSIVILVWRHRYQLQRLRQERLNRVPASELSLARSMLELLLLSPYPATGTLLTLHCTRIANCNIKQSTIAIAIVTLKTEKKLLSKIRTKQVTFDFAFTNSSVRFESEICRQRVPQRWTGHRESTFCKLSCCSLNNIFGAAGRPQTLTSWWKIVHRHELYSSPISPSTFVIPCFT